MLLSTLAPARSSTPRRILTVAAFLAGTSATPPIGLHPQAGTLSLFQGHLAIHRVAPVAGTRSRINAVLTYGAEPDMQLSDLTRQLFYGRLA